MAKKWMSSTSLLGVRTACRMSRYGDVTIRLSVMTQSGELTSHCCGCSATSHAVNSRTYGWRSCVSNNARETALYAQFPSPTVARGDIRCSTIPWWRFRIATDVASSVPQLFVERCTWNDVLACKLLAIPHDGIGRAFIASHGQTRSSAIADKPRVQKISKIYSFVLAQLTNVTDRRTDTGWQHIPHLCTRIAR